MVLYSRGIEGCAYAVLDFLGTYHNRRYVVRVTFQKLSDGEKSRTRFYQAEPHRIAQRSC